jgi:valyl-tRNA synthetase
MSAISKQYNFSEEDAIYVLWEKSGFFNPDNLDGEPYSIIMPPPNVTGVLHLGHAFENTLMDIMARYQRMQGKKVLILPGTDHAAVATQAKVEKVLVEKGIKDPRKELGREKLLEEIRNYAEDSKTTILKQIRKMGTSCDWSRLAYTFDEKRNVAVNEVFKKMYDDGLIYRGFRVVNWSVKGQSTCSDDELIHIERKAKLYTFKYSQDFPIYISTTRPETKLGDTAVAVNPKDKRYKKYVGQTFEVNVGAKTPLKIKIIADQNVDEEFGTGALGVTPAHSSVDFEMYERQKAQGEPIGFIQVIGNDGKMTEAAGKEYAGLPVEEAREKFVAWLGEKGLLEKTEEITQNVGTSDRFGDVVEALPMTQWFIDVNKIIPGRKKSLKGLMREAVEKISITPKRFEKNYLNWIENLRDWCISRQIWWGHRIPVYYRKEEIFVGTEAPQGEGWVRDEDTLDTWFSSGLWTFSTLGWPVSVKTSAGKPDSSKNLDKIVKTGDLAKFHPTSWMQMGHEILFFWMARMILMTIYNLGEIPFKDVYIHGMVKNEKGQKFSKSAGNNIDPLDLIQKYGTDALRASLISGITPGNDSKYSSEKIENARNLVTKIWNIFVYANNGGQNFKLEETISGADLKSVSDRWIVSRLETLVKEITDDLEKFNFSLAQEKLRTFTWSELADWYVEIHKIEKNSKVLGYVLDKVIKMWHPFVPFVTEKMWSVSSEDKNLLMVQKWPAADKKLINQKAEKEFEKIVAIISKIRNIRSSYHIDPATKLDVYAEKTQENEIIERLARVKIMSGKIKGKKLMEVSVPDFSLQLDIAGLIEVEKEMRSIGKEIANLEGLIGKSEAMLKNKVFTKNAPREIVEANRQKLAEYKEKLEIQKNLQKNLKKLS